MKILYTKKVVEYNVLVSMMINLYNIFRGVTMRQKQIEESLTMITDGFFDLLTIHNYDDITMSNIAIAAKLSRMTLYRYFKNKEEIITYYIQDAMNRFKQKISEHPSPNFIYVLYLRNQMIYEDKKLRAAFKHETVEKLFRAVIRQSDPLINSMIVNNDKLSKYKKLFVEGGIFYITRDWVSNGMKETPEQLTKEYLKILSLLSES